MVFSDFPFNGLLLLVGGAFGWAWAHRDSMPTQMSQSSSRAAALAGLNSLVHDDADQAIAALSRAVESEPGAVELQLTLGGLFRKRGEIDRAIQLHQGVVNAAHLTPEQLAQAQLELAQDYLKGGVMDRAEELAQQALNAPGSSGAALDLMLDLYEQARDWPQAIATAERWQSVHGRSAALRLAQYHCELAETALNGGDTEQAERCARQAQTIDPTCVRAAMLLGAICEKRGQPHDAMEHYRRGLELAPEFAVDLLPALERTATAAADLASYDEILLDASSRADVSGPLTLARARRMSATGGRDAADFVAQRLLRKADWRSLVTWLELSGCAETAGPSWAGIRAGVEKQLAAGARYRCKQCGFTPGLLFWQCPSCKQWDSVRPIESTV